MAAPAPHAPAQTTLNDWRTFLIQTGKFTEDNDKAVLDQLSKKKTSPGDLVQSTPTEWETWLRDAGVTDSDDRAAIIPYLHQLKANASHIAADPPRIAAPKLTSDKDFPYVNFKAAENFIGDCNLGVVRKKAVGQIMSYIDDNTAAYNRVPSPKRIIVVEGIRRCGKTFVLRQVIAKLVHEKNVPCSEVFYHEFNTTDTNLVQNFPMFITHLLDTKSPKFIVLDEIQNAREWGGAVRLAQDKCNEAQIIICGSTTGLTRDHSLVGRTDMVVMHPFSYNEFCDYLNSGSVKLPGQFTVHLYLRWGGFPFVVLMVLQLLTSAEISKGNIVRAALKIEHFFVDLVTALLDEAASTIDRSVLETSLWKIYRGEGSAIDANYLQALHKVYLIQSATSFESITSTTRTVFFAPDVGLLHFMNYIHNSINLQNKLHINDVIFSHLLAAYPTTPISLHDEHIFRVNSTLLVCVLEKPQKHPMRSAQMQLDSVKFWLGSSTIPPNIGVVSPFNHHCKKIIPLHTFLSNVNRVTTVEFIDDENAINYQDQIFQKITTLGFFDGPITPQFEIAAHQVSANSFELNNPPPAKSAQPTESAESAKAPSSDEDVLLLVSKDGEEIKIPQAQVAQALQFRVCSNLTNAHIVRLPFALGTVQLAAEIISSKPLDLTDISVDVLCELYAIVTYLEL